MALPASPPISLSDICTEFAAPPTTPLGSFLRGGAYVADTPANAGVPAALPISIADLLGASSGGGGGGGSVNLADHALFSARGAGIASVTYQFNAAGTVQWAEAPSNSGTYAGEWLLSGSAASYEVRVTGASSTVLTGIAGSIWQNAAANWSAVLSTGAPGTTLFEILSVDIRPAGGGATLASAAVEMYAERF